MRSTGVLIGGKKLCRKEFDRVKKGRMFERHCLRSLQNARRTLFTFVRELSKDIIYFSEDK